MIIIKINYIWLRVDCFLVLIITDLLGLLPFLKRFKIFEYTTVYHLALAKKDKEKKEKQEYRQVSSCH